MKSSYLRRGFFNRYHKNMPFAERLLKDLNHIKWSIRSLFRHGRIRRIIIHPHYPSRKATIYRIARLLDLQVTNRVNKKADLGIFYEYTTYKKEFQELQKRADDGLRVLNLNSRDIGKIHVDKVHKQVFGYATEVDPTTYQGKCVRKSDVNALHDGVILDCPIEKADKGFIYQKLIDNKNDEGLFEDIRIAVIGKSIPIAYLKFRKPEEQFGHRSRARLVDVGEVLNPQELEQVREYVTISGIDYAEIDILRDRDDGRIYIIDVNDTPQSARDNLSKEVLEENIRILSESFRREFLD